MKKMQRARIDLVLEIVPEIALADTNDWDSFLQHMSPSVPLSSKGDREKRDVTYHDLARAHLAYYFFAFEQSRWESCRWLKHSGLTCPTE